MRKRVPDKLADFDEQWWPITLLLLASAAGLAAYIYKESPPGGFETPVWYENTWVQISSVGVAACILLIGTAFLRGSAHRRLQLGIFFSLLFHASLLIVSHHYVLRLAEPPPGESWLAMEEAASVTIPDYFPFPAQTPGDPLTELSKPAETKIPEEAKTEVAPKELEQDKAEKKPLNEPDPLRSPQATPQQLARVELQTPKLNEVLAEEKLSRREIEEKLRMEAATMQTPTAASAAKEVFVAEVLEMICREAAAALSRRADIAAPLAALRPTPNVEPPAPARRDMPDQTASADIQAELARKLTTAVPEAMPLAPAEAAAARAAVDSSLNASLLATTQNRQAAASSAGEVAPSISPAVTFAQGSATPAALVRAEAPDPSDLASTDNLPNRQQRISGGAAAMGVESVPVEVPNAPTSTSAGAAGGATLDVTLTTVARGDSGTPQQALAADSALPSPIGSGSGATIGSEAVGMRRADAAGDGTAGLASASNVVGRPGRGRTIGSAEAATNQLSGGRIAGITGPAVRAGNATTGAATGLVPAMSGAGSSLGRRTVAQTGTGLRPSTLGGTTGLAASAPSGGMIGGTGIGSGSGNTGTGTASGSPTGSAAGTRRDIGESGDVAGSASGTAPAGLGARGRSSAAGNGAGIRAGDGMVSVTAIGPGGGTPGGTGTMAGTQNGTTPGGSGQALEAVAGGDSLRRGSSGVPVMAAAPAGPGGLTARPTVIASGVESPTNRPRETTLLADSTTIGRRARTLTTSPEAWRDRHGNLVGSINDLIVDGQMKGQKILLISFYVDEEVDTTPLTKALETKGYVVEWMKPPLIPLAEFAAKIEGCRQLWLFSSEKDRLPATHLQALIARWRSGRLAICLLADNYPFTVEAEVVLNAISPGSTITGDYLGERKLSPRGAVGPGFDRNSPLFHNVESLYEGTTISTVSGPLLTPVCYASNGLPLIATLKQAGSSRLLVHCGFTSFYERFWDDAGVSRFAVNVAGWLSDADANPNRPPAPPPPR